MTQWPLTDYELYYKIGLDIETSFELQLAPTNVVTITLVKECDATGPTFSQDPTNYKIGDPVSQINFTGDSATCLYNVHVLNVDLSPLDTSIFTFN